MSLGLKEVLSISTDFVSRKDEILRGNDKSFSKMNDSEIEIAAKALLREELQKTPSLGVTEVEQLSKEAQTIFSDIVAWMLERKKKDYEGAIAKENENAEWWESLSTTSLSILGFVNGVSNLLEDSNKGKLTKYQESLIDTKIAQLRLFADNNGNVLQNARNKLSEINSKIRACDQAIETLTTAINEYPQKKEPYEDFKNSFDSYNKDQPEENLNLSGILQTDKFTAWTNTLNTVGIPERDKNDITTLLDKLRTSCEELQENLTNNDSESQSIQRNLDNLNRFKSEFIDIFNINHADNNLLRFQNNLQYINSHETLKKMYGTGPTQVTAGRKWSENTGITNQNRFLSLWYQCHEVALARQGRSGAEIRDKNNQAKLMFNEFTLEFDKELQKSKGNANEIAREIDTIVIKGLTNLNMSERSKIQEKTQKEKEKQKLEEQRTQAQENFEYVESLNGKLPWEEENKGNFGANIHYNIECQVSLDVDPVIIDPFFYPITGSTNTKNTNIAQKLIKRLEDRKKFTGMSSRQIASQFVQRGKDAVDICRTFTQFSRVSLAHKNEIMKRKFNRAADCYGAIPTVLKAVLANLEAGFSFNNNKQRQRIS